MPPVDTPPMSARVLDSAFGRLCLLLLCAAYIQGGLVKMFDFAGAVAEMRHFGLEPAVPIAALTIALELGAPLLIVVGIQRWLGATALAAFTFAASFIANRFWEMEGAARTMSTNAFFEHVGLAGAFLLVAWLDRSARAGR